MHEHLQIEECNAVAKARLEDAVDRTPHIYSVIDAWSDQLSNRDRDLMRFRLCQSKPVTLQALGDEFGITRERVRQIENNILNQLRSFMRTADGRLIRCRVENLQNTIGVAVLLSTIEPMLDDARRDQDTDYRSLLLRLAGPYAITGEWIVLKSAMVAEPTRLILDSADEHNCIDRSFAAMKLDEWGLDESRHEAWLSRDGKVRELNGHLVRWDVGALDKLAFALFDLGRAATIEELINHIGWNGSVWTLNYRISNDSRFARANKKEWALASWGMPEYSGIVGTIRSILEDAGQPMPVINVIKSLSNDFNVLETSALSYCYAPMFVMDDGWIRLRSLNEPWSYNQTNLRRTKGVFALQHERLGLLIEVNHDVLRGSGRHLSLPAGSILDVKVNDELVFTAADGLSVTVAFPDTSNMGPNLGSVRLVAESKGAKLGDWITLIFDRTDMSVEARVTDASKFEKGWQLVARLTGIDAYRGIDGLAEALKCDADEVLTVLNERGDLFLAEALSDHSRKCK